MLRRPPEDAPTADAARRRLAALTAELAAARGEPLDRSVPSLPRIEAPTADLDEVPEPPATGRHARRPLAVGDRVTGWLGDRVPLAARPRPHLGAAQMGVVLVVLAVGLLGAAWWLVRASGGPGEVVPPRVLPAASESSSAGASPAAETGAGSGSAAPSTGAVPAEDPGTAAGEGQIVVDVVGRVRRPGIAVLPTGSRVVDAVRAAGGLRRGVDRTTLNLARLLSDGEQVLIGVGGTAPHVPPGPPGDPTGTSPPTSSGATLVNINTADQATLETLPGIGPVTAAAILQWRTEHGGFTAVEELLEVSGIGDATLAEITPFVTL